MAGTVAEIEAQEGLAAASGPQLLFSDEEEGGDRGVGSQGRDEGSFHADFFLAGLLLPFPFAFLMSLLSGEGGVSSMLFSETPAVST
jgi:hypothetical protein